MPLKDVNSKLTSAVSRTIKMLSLPIYIHSSDLKHMQVPIQYSVCHANRILTFINHGLEKVKVDRQKHLPLEAN